MVTSKGERRLVVWSNTVLRGVDGRPVGVASLGDDVTERRIADEEIRRLNADLERRVAERTVELTATNDELEAFAYSISHDLRAPLRHIAGFSDLLAERIDVDTDAESGRYLDTIRGSAVQMATLIDDLLSFSRTGRVELSPTEIDMDRLVRLIVGAEAGIPPHATD